ncbi:arylalkylamine N-acetyltransferase 1 [Lasioglossum baleicum]|uniref:arylalkylamine N-acetyltransferase 1 n=1 Tax=Lasioglossum baleicum TaxID=434251 RepID=UPI003FCD14A7
MTMSILILFRRWSILKGLKATPNCQRIGNRQANFHLTRPSFKLQTKCEEGPFFTTRLALPPDYENVTDFMCDAFYHGEPSIQSICNVPAIAPPSWREIMYDQVKAGLSIIAETRDRCVIGASLNTVVYPSDPIILRGLAEKMESPALKEVMYFYSYIAGQPNIYERFCIPRVFEVTSLAVSKEYRGRGVGRRLFFESWYLARDCDYAVIHVACTNRAMIKVCDGFQMQEVWNIPFDQYVRNGEVILKNITEPHTICKVYIDFLRECKTYCKTSKKCPITPPPSMK